MRIQEIKIENFRGFYKEISICFDNKPFILLSAPNGIGKTSVIDAIEWCITGTIGRLKKAYDNRSSNAEERKKNLDGILKNKNAKANDYVRVELTFADDADHAFVLIRKQKKDELNPQSSSVELRGSNNDAECWLQENIGDNFYNFHFCDIQKSFEMQNKKRDSLPEMFESFISDYTPEKTISDNLGLFAEDVQRCIKDWKSEEEKCEREIEGYTKQLEKYKDEVKIFQYPAIIYWKGEQTEITTLSQEELFSQLHDLQSFGYDVVYSLLSKIVDDLTKKKMVDRLMKVSSQLENHGEKISDAIKLGLDKDSSIIDALAKRIPEYDNLQLNKDNFRKYCDMLMDRKQGITREEYYRMIASIEESEKRISELEKEIEHLAKGNTVLQVFSDLLSHRGEIIGYRNEGKKCPICGSDYFSQISEDEILLEAESYIKKNNAIVASKNDEKKIITEQVENDYRNLLAQLTQTLEGLKVELRNQLSEYEQLQKDTSAFFIDRNAILTMMGNQITAEQLNSSEHLGRIISSLKTSFLQEEEIALYRSEYMSILTILDSRVENESEEVMAERMKNYVREGDYIEKYSNKIFSEKLLAIKSLLNSRDYLELSTQLKSAKEKKNEIKNKCDSLTELKGKAEVRSQQIRQLVSQLEQEEYASVGPNLRKYYKKLARIDAIESIELLLDGEQISIVDEKKKNVVNILSNGQLGVFMLSYFFAGVTTRSKTEKCKIYFLDDLTSCMDDINMLAFLDLLKYQMTSKSKNMEQIFFVTCEEKICKLLRYKLEGCAIPYRELTEKDFITNEIVG